MPSNNSNDPNNQPPGAEPNKAASSEAADVTAAAAATVLPSSVEGQLEERIDLSVETEAQIAQAQSLVQASRDQLPAALALLGAWEKKCRVGNDTPSLKRVCVASLELCQSANDPESLVSTLQLLASRRSQKSAAIQALVQTAMPWCVVLDTYQPLPVTAPHDIQARNRLVLALRDISNGKLYLERERAVLTRALATIRESEGNVVEAAKILQEVHVETYGSLSKRDKVEFILEQLRLTLVTRDYVRAAIVASKISPKHLQEETMQQHKLRFYTLMTSYHIHIQDALALAQDYHAMYSTPSVLQDEVQWKQMLQSAAIFLVLAPYTNEQQDLLHKVALDPNLEHLEAIRRTVQLVLRQELVAYPLPDQVELESIPALHRGDEILLDDSDRDSDTAMMEGTSSSSSSASSTHHKHWMEVLQRRIVQHNLRVAALYYSRIQTTRLATLLGLTVAQLELEIASLVCDGTLYAKINRPQGIVRFAVAPTPESTLTEWAGKLDTLLQLVETTTHLIHKEHNTTNAERSTVGGAGGGARATAVL